MRITKILSVLALFLLTCQTICGLHLAANPTTAAGGGTGFHLVLGVSTLVVVLSAVVSLFRAMRTARRGF